MTTKNNNSINANITGERNNIHINVPASTPDKKDTSNWLLKLIVGGIITTVTTLFIYYVQSGGGKPSRNPESFPKVNQIEGVKQK